MYGRCWRVCLYVRMYVASNISVNYCILIKNTKNVCTIGFFLLLKESIDIIDNIKMYDVPSKVKLAYEKLKFAGLAIFNVGHL